MCQINKTLSRALAVAAQTHGQTEKHTLQSKAGGRHNEQGRFAHELLGAVCVRLMCITLIATRIRQILRRQRHYSPKTQHGI